MLTTKFKIIFIGCVDFSREMLKSALNINGLEIVGIVSKSRSDFNNDFVSLLPIAEQLKIPKFDFSNTEEKGNLNSWIQKLSPDLILCLGWSHLLEDGLLKIPRIGVLGYHPAELPKNRGRHPIIWTLALGLKQSASTFFLMDGGADSGPITSQSRFEISDTDDASSVYDKLKFIASNQLVEIFKDLAANGRLNLQTQDHSRANTWRKRGTTDGIIDWRMPAAGVYNLVRALSHPYVGAEFLHGDQKFKVWKSRIVECKDENLEPGKILSRDRNSMIVKCGTDSIELMNIDLNKIEKNVEYL